MHCRQAEDFTETDLVKIRRNSSSVMLAKDKDKPMAASTDFQHLEAELRSITTAHRRSVLKERPAILELPVDLILNVGDYLPLSALVAFTLTCRTILRIYGVRKWDQLRRSRLAQTQLLDLLEREPGYFILNKPFGYAITLRHLALYFDHKTSTLNRQSISLDHFGHSASITASHLRWARNMTWDDNQPFIPGPNSLDTVIDLEIVPRRVSSRLLLRSNYAITDLTTDKSITLSTLQNLGLEICTHMSTLHRHGPRFDNNLADNLVPVEPQRPTSATFEIGV